MKTILTLLAALLLAPLAALHAAEPVTINLAKRTWTEGKPTSIATPHSRFFIRRPASGNLLLVNHYKFTGRSHLTAQISTDEGATWNEGITLDERGGPNFPNGVPGGVSYPDGVQDKDGLVWITCDRNRNGLGEILLARFREEDVAACKNVSGAVSLKQVVNKLDKSSLLPANWDPALAGDIVMQRLVKVTAPQVKGAHDAEFVCVGDRAYIVSEVNDLRGGEDGGWPFIYSTLSIVNLKPLKTEQVIDFAKGEQAFANETLPAGACWVPRIIQKGPNTLRCYFVSQAPGKRQSQMWYRDFDLSRGEFAPTIHKAKLKTAAGTFDFQPQHFHADAAAHGFRKMASDSFFFIFDSFKKFDGKLYVALNNFTGQQNALALVHDDLETFEVLGHYNEPQSAALSESAVNRLPDGTWMAICRNDKGNYHLTTSQDGRTWTIGEPKPFVPNGLNSKPTFDRFGGVYYLGWQEATSIQGANRSVFNVDISRDGKTWERKYRFETPQSFQYPAFHEHEGAIWLCVTQGDEDASRKERIMFGKLETVGEFETQQGQTRITWPSPPPAALPAAESNQPDISPGDALIAAPLNTVPGPEYQSAARLYQGIASIERHPSGRLWATWYSGGRGEGKENYVLVVTSADDGTTWSEPKLVIDPPGEVRAFDSCLWTTPDGRLLLFYAQADASKNLHDGRWGVWFTRCEHPATADSSWTKPVRIGDGIMMNKPTVIRNGSWLLPVAMWQDNEHGAGVVRSTDNGKGFQWIGGAGGGCLEHMIVERGDRSLWMLMRRGEGMAESFSLDGGVSWSRTTPAKIDGPGSRFHIRRIRSGRLLLVNHVGFVREGDRFLEWRSHLTALLSDDDGKTWPHQLLLDERNDVSYPDAIEAPDGRLYIIYDHGRYAEREILLAKFREEDVLAGKLVSTDAKLRVLVNKATGPRERKPAK